jgi:hypothetical protein
MLFQLDEIIALPIVDVTLFAMMEGYAPKVCSLIHVKRAGRRLTDARRIRQHGIEYRLEFARRTRDNLEYICRGSLLLQGFAQFSEQPCILDGDNCLSCEIFNQLYLFAREKTGFQLEETQRSDQAPITDHWRYENGSEPYQLLCCRVDVLWILENVRNLNRFVRGCSAPYN